MTCIRIKKKKRKEEAILTETYWGVLEQKCARDVLCRFRSGITELLCYKNRCNEDDISCPLCKSEPENEIHFLLTCPSHASIRSQFIPANDCSASLQDYFQIVMSHKKSDVIRSTAKYLDPAFKLRIKSE